MQLAYDLQKPIIHNASPHTLGDTLEIVTPPEGGAYAAEFPLNRAALPRGSRLYVTLVVRVLEGAIAIGTLLADGTRFYQVAQAEAEDGSKTVEMVTASGNHAGSIILLNASLSGCSRAQVSLIDAVPPRVVRRSCEHCRRDGTITIRGPNFARTSLYWPHLERGGTDSSWSSAHMMALP